MDRFVDFRHGLAAAAFMLALAACTRQGPPAPVVDGESGKPYGAQTQSAPVARAQAPEPPPSKPVPAMSVEATSLPPPSAKPAAKPAPASAPVTTAPQPSAPMAETPGTVRVQAGDTVFALSRRLNVGVRTLIEANDLKPPYQLVVGQALKIPSIREHVVQKGETLYAIARAEGVSAKELIAVNNLAPPHNVVIGQRLRLPQMQQAAVVSSVPSSPPPPLEKPADSVKIAEAPPSHPVAQEEPASSEPAHDDAPSPPPQTAEKVVIPQPPARGGKDFLWPAQGRIVSRFGRRDGGLQNDGINIAVAPGTSVQAAENGVVVYAGNELRGYGNLVLVKHEGGWTSAYAHNSEILVRRGDTVRRGQSIAKAGSSGNVAGPQVHFELRRGVKPVNPLDYLKAGKPS